MPDNPWLAAVREVLEPLRRKHFVNEEDCWYTCSVATDEHDGGHTCRDYAKGTPCDCGADQDNARLDAAMERIAKGLRAAVLGTTTEETCFEERESLFGPIAIWDFREGSKL